MNPLAHAKISVKKRGGKIEDYYPIHFFMDSTKELCSDNRHRVLHNLWGVRRVVIPIFGHSIVNSDGKEINVKDLCEQDHILPDYGNKFIPTLGDFVNEFEELSTEEQTEIDRVYASFADYPAIQSFILSPLNVTGQLKALRLTHNTWFCNEIIPKIFSVRPRLLEVSKINLFQHMQFKLWMDNGSAYPTSKLTFGHTS
jgi:hypothetical protein